VFKVNIGEERNNSLFRSEKNTGGAEEDKTNSRPTGETTHSSKSA
jgi:hypothetical protein